MECHGCWFSSHYGLTSKWNFITREVIYWLTVSHHLHTENTSSYWVEQRINFIFLICMLKLWVIEWDWIPEMSVSLLAPILTLDEVSFCKWKKSINSGSSRSGFSSPPVCDLVMGRSPLETGAMQVASECTSSRCTSSRCTCETPLSPAATASSQSRKDWGPLFYIHSFCFNIEKRLSIKQLLPDKGEREKKREKSIHQGV